MAETIDLAIIGGSAAHELLASARFTGERLGEQDTPFGKSQPLYQFEAGGVRFHFLPRHGEMGYHVTAPYVNYRANIFALKDIGTKRILAWSGPGAITPAYEIGQFVVPHDMIDETHSRVSTFYTGGSLGFIRLGAVFCPTVRTAVIQELRNLGLKHQPEGIYVCTEGPRLETPAEIRKYAMFGANLVGMTLAPEAFLARELEMCYAALCYVTNYAEGVAHRTYKPGELFEGLSSAQEMQAMQNAVNKFPDILAAFVRLPLPEGKCVCHRAMERYKKRGDIGEDWRAWVGR